MKYRYIGEDNIFAKNGDIFEKGKHGYTHNYGGGSWIGVPEWMVETFRSFELVNEEIEEIKPFTDYELACEPSNSSIGKKLNQVINCLNAQEKRLRKMEEL